MPNCTAHVDRGLLSVVVVPEVRGLVVLDPGAAPGSEWVDPAAGAEPLRDCVVTVNHELQERSSRAYRACVHGVEKAPGRPRLSISFELRTAC